MERLHGKIHHGNIHTHPESKQTTPTINRGATLL